MKKATVFILPAVLLCGCTSASAETSREALPASPGASINEPEISISAEDTDESFSISAGTIVFSDSSAAIKGAGISSKGTEVTIASPGTYVISGKCENASISVDCEEKGTVHLVLNNADLSNPEGTVINVEQADKTILTGYTGTDNTLSSTAEGANAVSSKDDLVINGSGTINLSSEGDALHASDDLLIVNAIMNISGNDGIDVNDTLTISDSILSITAQKDGIHAGKEGQEDGGEGDVILDGGMLNVKAEDDGIDALGSLTMQNNPSLAITAGDGSDGAEAHQKSFYGWNQSDSDEEESKSKGISLDGDALLYSGTIHIDSEDDAINSASAITVYDGDYAITAGDDGIHADTSLTVENGNLKITSYEGLESSLITINGGTTQIDAGDDGINAASGTTAGMTMQPDGSQLVIHGGNITIDADGDGVDSNGDISMDGGELTIYGPESNMNGALDYNGSFTVSGGTILAGGSSGMLQSISDDSSIHAVVIGITDDSGAVAIEDEDGNEIASYTSDKSFSSLIFASDALKEGKTYTVYENGKKTGTAAVSDTTVYINFQAGRGMQGGLPRSSSGPQGRGQNTDSSEETRLS